MEIVVDAGMGVIERGCAGEEGSNFVSAILLSDGGIAMAQSEMERCKEHRIGFRKSRTGDSGGGWVLRETRKVVSGMWRQQRLACTRPSSSTHPTSFLTSAPSHMTVCRRNDVDALHHADPSPLNPRQQEAPQSAPFPLSGTFRAPHRLPKHLRYKLTMLSGIQITTRGEVGSRSRIRASGSYTFDGIMIWTETKRRNRTA